MAILKFVLGVLVGLVLIALLVLVGTLIVKNASLIAAEAPTVVVATAVPSVAATPVVGDSVAPQTAVVVAPAEAPFVWNGEVGTLGHYITDADPTTSGFKVKNAPMAYVCTFSIGVFISMDPGTVMGISTQDKGAVAFVPCGVVGKSVNLTTTFWNDNSGHQSVHLFEVIAPIPGVEPLDILMALKTAEAKPIALFFKADGTYELK